MPVMVDGWRMPALVAGDPALEICNTRAAWTGGDDTHEYLLSYGHFAFWARYAGLLPIVAQADPQRGASVLDRALRFRSAYHAALTGGTPDWDLLDREIRSLPAGLAPAPASPGAWDLGLATWDFGADAEAPLRAVVHAAARMLTSPQSRQVRSCPGVGCGWLFHDPRGRRRWCVMAVCGNRTKVARHAARTRSAAGRHGVGLDPGSSR